MQMTFDAAHEEEFFACRDRLCARFAEWAEQQSSDADASDVQLLLDWKWGYADGRLDHWVAEDVEEFLLAWCPRKVVAPPELVADIPSSVGAYVEFLEHERLLAPGCSAAEVRRTCAELEPRFRVAMADPVGHGVDPRAFLEQLAAPSDADARPATAARRSSRDEPAADAGELVTSMRTLDEAAARTDLAAWAAANPSGAGEIVAAALRPEHGPTDVLGLLEHAGSVFGPAADDAVKTHLDGPRAPLLTMWLLLRGALEASSVDPELMLVGTVEIAAAMLDDAGPGGLVEFFGADVDEATDVLGQLWRAEHGRTAEVLDVLAHHHPDKTIAEAARRSAMQARGRG